LYSNISGKAYKKAKHIVKKQIVIEANIYAIEYFSLVNMLTTSNALLLFNFILESKAFHEPKPLRETDQILKNRESIEKAEAPKSKSRQK
jgi:hypothetical protein